MARRRLPLGSVVLAVLALAGCAGGGGGGGSHHGGGTSNSTGSGSTGGTTGGSSTGGSTTGGVFIAPNDTTGPTVTFISPTAASMNPQPAGNLTVTVEVTDASSIASVDINGTAATAGAGNQWSAQIAPELCTNIAVTATDAAGNPTFVSESCLVGD